MTFLNIVLNVIQICYQFLRNDLQIGETVFDSRDIFEYVRSWLGLWPQNINMADRKYYTASIENWSKIIERDWINRRTYIAERFDCDDFSRCFIAHCLEIYGLNSVGEMIGIMIKGDTAERHSFVVFFDDKKDFYILEPQTDEMILFRPGKPVKIGDRYYGFEKLNI